MCGLIAQALERRDGRAKQRVVQASPQQKAPDMLDRSLPTKPATPPPAGSKKREVEDRVDEKWTCDASEQGPRGGGEGSAVTARRAIILGGAQREPDAPKALRSPPRVRRVVTRHFAALPTLARRSNARRDCRRRQKRARRGKTERDTGMSSVHLAEAIGCHSIPTGLAAAVENDGDTTVGWSALDGQHRDLHGNKFKLESMGNVFRAGLDLGKTRFRGAGTV